MEGIRYKKFDEMNIVNCRNGKSHDYEVVKGPMADDTIYNYISDYIDGYITKAAFWELAKFRYPDLFYLCSLIEFIGRETKNKGSDIVNILGYDNLLHIFNHAEVYHCERIESVADEYINDFKIKKGNYDQVSKTKDNYPTYWDLGKIYMRLIRDTVKDGDLINKLIEIYNSWIVDSIENYNSSFYYMSPEYIKACY